MKKAKKKRSWSYWLCSEMNRAFVKYRIRKHEENMNKTKNLKKIGRKKI